MLLLVSGMMTSVMAVDVYSRSVSGSRISAVLCLLLSDEYHQAIFTQMYYFNIKRFKASLITY